jgi:hypothetical protein
MKKITLNYFTDPGHGWVKIKVDVLKKLGISDKISPFSYRNGDNAFLEEDCDCSVLIKELKDRGIEFKFVENHTNKSSKIRNYYSYYA